MLLNNKFLRNVKFGFSAHKDGDTSKSSSIVLPFKVDGKVVFFN